MDHPFLSEERKPLRRSFTTLLKGGYDLARTESIVFVCGGNDPNSARQRFLEIARRELPERDIFLPEFVIDDYLSEANGGPFNIAKFEEIIASLSFVVVIFPEEPGAICETGYFAANNKIVRKVLLAISNDHKDNDSFISIGPGQIITEKSFFSPTQYIDYAGDFAEVLNRIKRSKVKIFRSPVRVPEYRDASTLEKMAICQKIVEVMHVATIDDVNYIFRSAFKSHISTHEIRQLMAILYGSGYLKRTQPYGHYSVVADRPTFLVPTVGQKRIESGITLAIAADLSRVEEAHEILREARNAA
ncbi:MAG: retron St85 family effector protein [Sphingomicrobium sp.]